MFREEKLSVIHFQPALKKVEASDFPATHAEIATVALFPA